jgi:hypothetical protein
VAYKVTIFASDNWLDQGSFKGRTTIQFRGAGGKVIDLRLRQGMKDD